MSYVLYPTSEVRGPKSEVLENVAKDRSVVRTENGRFRLLGIGVYSPSSPATVPRFTPRPSSMRLFALYATSIIAGFCMMSLEIVGARLLQPVFGSSIDVWAAIITVFILSLSIGYVIGGRVADRAKSNAILGWILTAAGACFMIIPAVALPFMEALPSSLTHARWGVLVAALVLFIAPSLLLGVVSPILVKLVFVSAERVGTTTGTLYAVGSFGNVLGILVSNYVLLQYVDINHTIYAEGIVLGLLGVAHLLRKIDATGHLVATEVPPAARGSAAGAVL